MAFWRINGQPTYSEGGSDLRNWQIDLIHHSHTDIGYTDRQENIRLQHTGFLRQAIGILRGLDGGNLPGCEGFRWQCENFWQIENFLSACTEEERKDLAHYVREGRIGLSGSYLNLTELVDAEVLEGAFRRASAYAEKAGRPLKSAMTADINGYAWGTPDLMAKAGMKYLFCALHTHHGMFPMNKNPSFFMWEGPEGNQVLTFVGEHYHWGNVLGFCPRGNSNFMLHDEFHTGTEDGTLLRTDDKTSEEQELVIAATRIRRYLDDLEDSGYPLDLVPLMVSGIISDNGPPNAKVAERVNRLNALLGPGIRIRMAVLDDFFSELEKRAGELPVYRGDFTDWWADGVGSVPAPVCLYREAQRAARLVRKLAPERTDLLREAEDHMMLYSEHTFSYSSSVFRPWEPLVNAVATRKTAYAALADECARRALNTVLEEKGLVTLNADGTQNYRILNPHPVKLTLPVEVTLQNWETVNGCAIDRDKPVALRNTETGELLCCQNRWGSRGLIIETAVTLEAGESMRVSVCEGPDHVQKLDHIPRIGADAVTDIENAPDSQAPWGVETDYFRVRVSREKGIFSITDKLDGTELLRDLPACGAFGGVYDVTPPVGGTQTQSRRAMGRKRVSVNTERSFSRVKSVLIEENGPVYITLKLSCALTGTEYYEIRLKMYKHLRLFEASVRLHKTSVQSAESVYTALPFLCGKETWADKSGCLLRPGKDQLPGTCGEYWLIQNGVQLKNGSKDILLAFRDNPLITLGLPEAGPVTLCSDDGTERNRAPLFCWLMNNFWETNFNVNLAGFYEFRFRAAVTDGLAPRDAFEKISAMNEEMLVIKQ